MGTILDIRAQDLEDWANQYETPGLLPVLLRQLVNTTCLSENIQEIEFPSDESVTYGGWDGRLKVAKGFQHYVPTGLSCWELSKQKDIAKKNRDIEKRSKELTEQERKNLSFVFVTPRKWTHRIPKADWESTKQKEFGWKNVKVLDSDNLTEWIEHSVPAQIYFANMSGRSFEIDGIIPSSRFWQEWTADCEPEFPRSLFDRPVLDHRDALIGFLNNDNASLLKIAANSFDEGLAFLHCVLSDKGPSENETRREMRKRLQSQIFLDRMLAVKEKSIIRDYAMLDKDFIPVFSGSEIASEYAKSGANTKAIHIIGINEDMSGNRSDFKIRNLTSGDFCDALQIGKASMAEHLSVDEKRKKFKKSGGSLTVLRRLLSESRVMVPEWHSNHDGNRDGNIARKLIPFMLAGFWKNDSDNDREILELISGKDYADLEDDFNDLKRLEDSPVWQNGNCQGVVSKIDAFFGIAGYFNSRNVKNFLKAAEDVLVRNNRPNVIRNLKTSIADTLLFLVSAGRDAVKRQTGIDVADKAQKFVETVIGDLDEKKIALHHENFKQYAEMAPDTFLKIMEKELIPNDALMKIMMNVNPATYSFYPDLLRALELLAWNPKYFKRAAIIMAEMAQYETDRFRKTPQGTLLTLFQWSYPQTFADEKSRMDVFKILVDQYPDTAWHIIKGQINGTYGLISNTQPKWNSDVDMDENPASRLYRNFYFHCLDIGINWKNHTRQTLYDLLPHVTERETGRKVEKGDDIWNAIISWASEASDDDKAWLRSMIWKLAPSTRSEIVRQVLKALESNDLCLKNLWFFSEFRVPESREEMNISGYDYHKWDDRSKRKRRKAIREIYGSEGIDGIIRFCGMIEYEMGSRILGSLSAEIIDRSDVVDLMVRITSDNAYLNDRECREFVIGFSYTVKNFNRKYLSDIIDRIDSSASDDALAKFISLVPVGRDVWDILNNQTELEEIYWKSFDVVGLRGIPTGEIEFIASKLLQFERPYEALMVANLATMKDVGNFPHVKQLKLLSDILEELPKFEKPETFQHHDDLDVLQAIEALNGKLSQYELAWLEYMHGESFWSRNMTPPNLTEEISVNPAFFCEIVCDLFKDRNWKYHALMFFRRLKLTLDVYSDRQKLEDWIDQVMKIGAKMPEQDMIDHQIGDLLSKVPAKTGSFWPRDEVADMIQKFEDNEMLIYGVKMGYENNQEGGVINEERMARNLAAANGLERHADNYDVTHPKVAELLRYFASSVRSWVGHSREMIISNQMQGLNC